MISVVDKFGNLEFRICGLYYSEGKTIEEIAKTVKKRMSYISAVVAECREQYEKAKIDGKAIMALPDTESKQEDGKRLDENIEEQLEILVFNTMPEQILGMERQLMSEERDIELLMEEARQFNIRDTMQMEKFREEEFPAKTEEDIRNFKELQKLKKAEADRLSKKIGIFTAGSRARGNIFKKRKEVYQVATGLLGISDNAKGGRGKGNTTKISHVYNVDATGGKSLKSLKIVKEEV